MYSSTSVQWSADWHTGFSQHKCFCEKVASKTSHVKLQSLPSTSAAAKYHSLHVHLQVQEWKGSGAERHPWARDWGWQEYEEGFVLMQISLPPAPEPMLWVIRCNCQTDYSTLRCSCKEHNIQCSPDCSDCKGTGCLNNISRQWYWNTYKRICYSLFDFTCILSMLSIIFC